MSDKFEIKQTYKKKTNRMRITSYKTYYTALWQINKTTYNSTLEKNNK